MDRSLESTIRNAISLWLKSASSYYAVLQFVATIIVLVLSGAVFFWIRAVKTVKHKVLTVTRQRRHDLKYVEVRKRETEMTARVVRHLRLDPAVLSQPPFNYVDMMSIGDYYATLLIPGGFSIQRAIVTTMDRMGLGTLLPTALMLPAKWRETSETALGAFGQADFMTALLARALTPLHFYAVASAMSNATADIRMLRTENECMRALLNGEEAGKEPTMPEICNPFVIERDLDPLLESLGAPRDAPAMEFRPEPSLEFFPDLCVTDGGVSMKQTPRQVVVNRVMSLLMNRLAANAVPESYLQQPRPRFVVQLRADTPPIGSPEELLTQLTAERGADVQMGVVSRITSFGMGLSVKEGERYVNVPLAFPLHTGLSYLQTDTSNSSKDVVTLMCHSGIMLRVSGRALAFQLEWYQGIEGFTGWHSGTDIDRVWNNSAPTEVLHDNPAWTSDEQRTRACQATSVVSAVLNLGADRSQLPSGGYGYLGVCTDSVAAVQCALDGGRCTMFPLILGGRVKADLIYLYKEMEERLRSECGDPAHAAIASSLAKAMLTLPNDVVLQPANYPDVCRRVLACLPDVSPFAAVQECKDDIRFLLQQLDELGVA